ncbi:MAG: hypothetical protein AAFO03_20650, partial [Bacteroidota bacterium]
LIAISAVSNRMTIVGLSFVLGGLILTMMRTNELQEFIRQHTIFKWLVYIFFLLIIPQFIYWLSFFLSQISTYFLAFPLYPIIFGEGNIALIDTIKWVIGFS